MLTDGAAPIGPWGSLAHEATEGPIDRSYWVIAGRLAGGAYPFDADPEKGRQILDRLRRAGIDTFVNLTRDAEPGSTDSHLGRYDGHVDGSVVVHTHPITDLDIPTGSELVEILDTIDRSLGEGRSVYVHCWGGIGRTGTVIGCWLVRHRLAPPGAAIDVLAALRRQDQVASQRRSPETPHQRALVEEWRPGR